MPSYCHHLSFFLVIGNCLQLPYAKHTFPEFLFYKSCEFKVCSKKALLCASKQARNIDPINEPNEVWGSFFFSNLSVFSYLFVDESCRHSIQVELLALLENEDDNEFITLSSVCGFSLSWRMLGSTLVLPWLWLSGLHCCKYIWGRIYY